MIEQIAPIPTARRAYSTDLTDAQWQALEPLVPRHKAQRPTRPVPAP